MSGERNRRAGPPTEATESAEAALLTAYVDGVAELRRRQRAGLGSDGALDPDRSRIGTSPAVVAQLALARPRDDLRHRRGSTGCAVAADRGEAARAAARGAPTARGAGRV